MSAINLFKKVLQGFGIDRPVGYALIGRMLSVVTTPITLYCMATYLSPAAQGYYYTFGSLIGLTVFFELGLNTVIIQFASHEKAKLEWTSDNTLQGDLAAKSRLASLLRKTLSWYAVIGILTVLFVLPAGFIFLSAGQSQSQSVAWHIPWVLMVVASASWNWVSPVFSLLMGCGLVVEMQFNALVQQVGGALLIWLTLILGGGLYALPLSAIFGGVYVVAWMLVKKRAVFLDLWSMKGRDHKVSWGNEIWPMQWKIALSWTSSFLITQLFNPILFYYHGPVIAGQMGMTLNICMALMATSVAWVYLKAPAFGMLIAQRKFKELDTLFYRCLWQSGSVIILGSASLWLILVWLGHTKHPFSLRLLPPALSGLLLLNAVAMHFFTAQTIYLRAHKDEPFLALYVIGGIIVVISNYFLGRYLGAAGMVVGYLACTLIVCLGMGTWIFKTKRHEWHKG